MKIGTAMFLVLLVAAPHPSFALEAKQPPATEAGSPPATEPPIAPSGSKEPAPQAELQAQKAWRKLMAHTPFPNSGCYTSSYPSNQWQEIPCSTATARPHPIEAGGNGSEYSAETSKSLSSVTGSFDSVTNVTSETDSIAGANVFSLQINTNNYNSKLCDSSTCAAVQQYIYDSPGDVYIQYWLKGHGKNCPSKTIAKHTWTFYPGNPGAKGCFINGNQAPVSPSLAIKDLGSVFLTGTTSASSQSAVVGTPVKLYGHSDSGDFLGIRTQWKFAEFNVFGGGGGSEAFLKGTSGSGSTLVVRTSTEDGIANAPSCQSIGFTQESNNLPLVPPCCAISGPKPAILFTESSAARATSICKSPRPTNCFVSVIACQHLATLQCTPVQEPYGLDIEWRLANQTPTPPWNIIAANSLGSGSTFEAPNTQIEFRGCTFVGNGPKSCASILKTAPPNDRGCSGSGPQEPLTPLK
jgi:hypothetical protein